MKFKALTRKPKALRDVAVEPEMIPTKPEKKLEETMEAVDEDFPELKNIPTVMSFRSFDSIDDIGRPLRYSPTDTSNFDKYWGSVEGIGMSNSDSAGEPVWTHPAYNDDDDRDWFPEKNSFDHYEERVVAARKQRSKNGIVLPPSLRGTWSECDTLHTSPSEERSTKENDGKQDEKPHHGDATQEEKVSSTSPGSPLHEEQKENHRSTLAPLKSVLKKRLPVAVEATSPASSPKAQPSTATKPIQSDSPKAHSTAKVLAARSAADVVAASRAGDALSPTSTSSKTMASSSKQPSKSAGAADKPPTSISTKSKAEKTVPSMNTSLWEGTESSKKTIESTTPTKETVVVVPTRSSTKSNVETKDNSTSKMGRARLFLLRHTPRSLQKANSSASNTDLHGVASTPPSNDPPALAPNLSKSSASDSRVSGLTTATMPSTAVTSSRSGGSPSKERALQKAMKKTEGSPGATTDASSGAPSATTPSNETASTNTDTASNLPSAATGDFSSSAPSPTSPSARSMPATAAKNNDKTSNLSPATSPVASVATVSGLKDIEGKTKGDTKDTEASEAKQTRNEADKVETSKTTKEAAKLGSSGMKSITDKMISIGAAKVKSEARKEAKQKKETAKTARNAPKAGSVEEEEQTDSNDVGETKAKPEPKKEDNHANSKSQVTSETKETHRNLRFWKKRSELYKMDILQPEGAGEELAEDGKEAHPVLKTFADVNSSDNMMPKAAPVHESTNDFTTPTVEASMFKNEAAAAFLRQMQCGCLADCLANNKDAKWDGATNKAVVFNKLELDDEMDIDQAVAAMRRSRRNEPMQIKFIEVPEDYLLTTTSSVTDSQAGFYTEKGRSRRRSKSNKRGTIAHGRAKIILQKLGKPSRRRTDSENKDD